MPDDRFGFLDVGVPKALTPPAGYEAVHVAGMSWAIQGASLETTSWLSPAQWNHMIAQFRGLLTIASIDLSDVPDTSPLLLRETLVRAIEAAIAANATVIDIADAIAALRGEVDPSLDTLAELAAALGDDADFAGTMTTILAGMVGATAAFGTDNRLLRSDGTGRGAQASGIEIDDSDRLSGYGNMAWQTATQGSGQVSFDCLSGRLLAWRCTLTANGEVQVPANLPDGWTAYLRIDPAAYAATFAAGFVSPVPTFTGKALVAIVRDGSDYLATLCHEAA